MDRKKFRPFTVFLYVYFAIVFSTLISVFENLNTWEPVPFLKGLGDFLSYPLIPILLKLPYWISDLFIYTSGGWFIGSHHEVTFLGTIVGMTIHLFVVYGLNYAYAKRSINFPTLSKSIGIIFIYLLSVSVGIVVLRIVACPSLFGC